MPVHKKSPSVGQNVEFPIARKEEALNSRQRGGEFIPGYQSEQSIIPTDKERGSTGPKSKAPYQVSRPGERRI
jgi:hypothetical protein